MTREQILKRYPEATETEIAATLAKYNAPEQAEVEVEVSEDSFLETAKGVARSAGQGLTFGFGDELTALARSLFGAESYDELVQEERDALNAFREQHPELAYGAEILAGFALPGIGLAKGLGTAAKVALTTGKAGQAIKQGRAAQQVVARQPMTAGRAAKVGATQGGVYGVGASEGDWKNRVLGGAVGALTGGVISPVLAKAADPVIAARNVFKSLNVNPNAMIAAADKQAKRAAKRIMGIAARDIGGVRTKELAAQGKAPTEAYRDVLEEMGPDATIADVSGPRGQRFVSGLTQGSVEAASRADEIFLQRASGEFKRVTKEAARLMTARADADRVAMVLDKRASSLSQPLYRAAREGEGSVLNKNDFVDFFIDNAPDLQKAYKAAAAISRREGQPLPSWKEFIARDEIGEFLSPGVGIRVMQLIKQGLDDMVEVGGTPGTTIGKRSLSSLKGVRNEFNNRIGQFNPRFAAANKVREVGYKIKDAVEEGGKFTSVKMSDLDFERAFKRLKTDVERMAFRSGMLQHLRILGRKENQSLANKIFGDTLIKGRLKSTFPDDESFDAFMTTLGTESAYRKTQAIVTGGSRTGRVGTEIGETFGDAPGEIFQSGYEASINPALAAVRATGKAANWWTKFRNKKLAEEASQIEFTEPGKALEKLDQLQRIYTGITKADQELLQQLRRRLVGATSRIVGSGISTFAGSPNFGLLGPQ
jgi:hypothetical protein